MRKKDFSFLFIAKNNYQLFDVSRGAKEFKPIVRTLIYEVTNSEWPEQTIRLIINRFEQLVEFRLTREIDWRVLIDSHNKPD